MRSVWTFEVWTHFARVVRSIIKMKTSYSKSCLNQNQKIMDGKFANLFIYSKINMNSLLNIVSSPQPNRWTGAIYFLFFHTRYLFGPFNSRSCKSSSRHGHGTPTKGTKQQGGLIPQKLTAAFKIGIVG